MFAEQLRSITADASSQPSAAGTGSGRSSSFRRAIATARTRVVTEAPRASALAAGFAESASQSVVRGSVVLASWWGERPGRSLAQLAAAATLLLCLGGSSSLVGRVSEPVVALAPSTFGQVAIPIVAHTLGTVDRLPQGPSTATTGDVDRLRRRRLPVRDVEVTAQEEDRPTPTSSAQDDVLAAELSPSAEPLSLVVATTEVSAQANGLETFRCRKEVLFHLEPERAIIEVDGDLLGKAEDWGGSNGGSAWRPAEGRYHVELSHPRRLPASIRIDIDAQASEDACHVDIELVRARKGQRKVLGWARQHLNPKRWGKNKSDNG